MHLKDLSPNLMVADMDRTLAFYKDLLGLEIGMSVPHGDGIGWAMLTNGSITVMVETVEGMKGDLPHEAQKTIGGSFQLYCEVDDIDAAYRTLSGKAPILFELRETFYGAREFGVSDPDGYSVTFAQQGE